MKKIVVIDLDRGEHIEHIRLLGQDLQIHQIGCSGDANFARKLIETHDGRCDAIGLHGLPALLELGMTRIRHEVGVDLPGVARQTPVVDGRGVRAGLERWGVILADRAEPGILSRKRVLMVPGLNHRGLSTALRRRGSDVRYGDTAVFGPTSWRDTVAQVSLVMPTATGVGPMQPLSHMGPTLERLKSAPFVQLCTPSNGERQPRYRAAFDWADILAGNICAIRRYGPDSLKRKTIVVECATQGDIDDLRERGASIAITLMPPLDPSETLGRWPAATVEAALVALRPDPKAALSEDTYLDMLGDLDWTPAVRYLKEEDANVNRFAFVIHPLQVGHIHKHPSYRWTRHLPDWMVEATAAHMPPMYLSRITGGRSASTGQRIEGYLMTLSATPREMLRRDEHFTYKKLDQAGRMAERFGARIMGLGAFTSVVGDAGITVAHNADIAITSGNSLTVAATLEAAKTAAIEMGRTDLTQGKVMIIGATGSIGSVCSRLLAQAIFDVVLVSIEPERLLELKRTIQEETPNANVTIATRAGEYLRDCDLIVTSTSAFGERIIDISKCKPGAVICDVARPPDIGPREAALRPDVLVIESGEVLIPGEIDFGYDIGLPEGVAYACLGETALLAMDGRFEDYTLGRDISMERVKEIYRISKKHGFKLAGLRSFDVYLTPEMLQEKRNLAQQYRDDPALFEQVRRGAGDALAKMPPSAKGVRSRSNGRWRKLTDAATDLGGLARRLMGGR